MSERSKKSAILEAIRGEVAKLEATQIALPAYDGYVKPHDGGSYYKGDLPDTLAAQLSARVQQEVAEPKKKS